MISNEHTHGQKGLRSESGGRHLTVEQREPRNDDPEKEDSHGPTQG